jgi:hypothetical protein
VVLAALGGVATCCTVLLLFLGEVLGRGAATTLFIVFGGAVVFTMGALGAYVVEMLLAARGLRQIGLRILSLSHVPFHTSDESRS